MLIVLERLCSILPFVSFFLSHTHTLHSRINITLNEIILVCVSTLHLCLVGVSGGDSI